ncbi:MAG: alpha/beta-hydrolase family protein [Pseudomonadota bacterium]
MQILRTLIAVFSVPCLLVGLLFFATSLTPSLIPRGPLVQGVLGGLVTALGYLLGHVISVLWQAAELPKLGPRTAKIATIIAALVVFALLLWTFGSTLAWQNDLRVKMGLPEADALHLLTILLAALVTFGFWFALGHGVAALFRLIRARFYRIMPKRRANVFGFIAVVVVLVVVTRDGIFDRVVLGLDEGYEAAQELFDNAPPRPADPDAVGGENSLIEWTAMGQPGRDFLTTGPDAAAISRFTGAPALDPIRVYVGRANGETPQARAALALEELKRVGGFERKVLVVASPTGTGWMDPGSQDPLEYMHGGDVATVSAQYSYLQSPLALILESSTGLEQATALLEVVHEYWKTLPEGNRPRLYVHGLSLGAWSSMHATNLFRLLDDPINGAFWAGPPFPSDFWNYTQTAREPDSPWKLPTIGDGSMVRYASHYADASEAKADWGEMRIVFLQYSSDPIVFFDPLSLWREPQWMREPPAPDASAHLRFMPVVTQFQLALDMALSFGTPGGHGHAYYAQDYISPWVQVTAPEGWTSADTERLKAHCNLGVNFGCAND